MPVTVLVVRDPDSDNEIIVDSDVPGVVVLDMDLGRSFDFSRLGSSEPFNDEQWAAVEFCNEWLDTLADVPAGPVYDRIMDTILAVAGALEVGVDFIRDHQEH